MNRETSIGGPGARFLTTLWSTVRGAQEGCENALEQLLDQYWKPIYFLIRRKGNDVEAAKDLTQAFFAKALEKDYLNDYSVDRGRFRTFIWAAVSHFLSNERDRQNAKKRGGGYNFVEAEEQLAAADASPEQAFTRQWAVEIMKRAMDRLREQASPEDFALLSEPASKEISGEDKWNRLRRMRRWLRDMVCEELLPTLDSRAQLDSEIRDLFVALG